MVEYYSGTYYHFDDDGDACEYHVIWAMGKPNRWAPEEWILMEVNGKEEHQCDEEVWRICEEARGQTALRASD